MINRQSHSFSSNLGIIVHAIVKNCMSRTLLPNHCIYSNKVHEESDGTLLYRC